VACYRLTYCYTFSYVPVVWYFAYDRFFKYVLHVHIFYFGFLVSYSVYYNAGYVFTVFFG
jgi:hypothetical protein